MYRNSSWEEDLAKELQDLDFAQGFLLTLMEGEEGLGLEEALKHTVKSMGVKEFCDLIKLPISNVTNFLNGKRKLKPESLDVFLKPFGLKSKLVAEKAS